MADQDTLLALESAEFFQNASVQSQNTQNELISALQQKEQEIVCFEQKTASSVGQLELLGEQFGSFDLDQLIAQINRIQKQTQESQLLATELGYPVPQSPDILETVTQSALETIKNDKIIIDGVEKPAKTIAFSLLLAEISTLKTQNFLMRQSISESLKAKAQSKESDEVSLMDSVTRDSNPVTVYQQEFKGSGVQACRALIELRNRVASLLLREQRFNQNSLLEREAMDNETLRSMICGLQNELFIVNESVQEAMKFGVEMQFKSEFQLDDESVQKLADCALNEEIQVDLLPTNLARKIDFCIEQVAIQAETAAAARIAAGQAEIGVSELQKILEKRNETVKKLSIATGIIIDYIQTQKLDPDEAIMRFFKENNIQFNEETNNSKDSKTPLNTADSFQIQAFNQTQSLLKSFDSQIVQITQFMTEITQNLQAGNKEKFQQDGQGFIDALEKISFLVHHTRNLHHNIAKRDFTISKLQKIIVQIQSEKRDLTGQNINLVGVRNGLVCQYLQLKQRYQNVQFENQTIKSTASNPVNLALTSFKTSALAAALSAESSDYTRSVSGLVGCIQLEVSDFGRKIATVSQKINESLAWYRGVVENRDQKGVQTDRVRKQMDLGVQVVVVEAVDPKGKKK